MPLYRHTLSDGTVMHIQLKHSAKKNLILRPVDADTVSINIPPYLSATRLNNWLSDNEALLHQTLAKAAQTAALPADSLPEWLWYRGEQMALREHHGHSVMLMPSEIYLPRKPAAQQKLHLRRFLHAQAQSNLLPRLNTHAEALGLYPAATALSNAKTFWGVCRARTGIRLNWRLIGAPDFVTDYVCIHELCHLPHPDHSPRFWDMVNHNTPHTDAAKTWLKAHGQELFALD